MRQAYTSKSIESGSLEWLPLASVREMTPVHDAAPDAIDKTGRVVAPLPKPTIVIRPLPRASGPHPSLGIPRDFTGGR